MAKCERKRIIMIEDMPRVCSCCGRFLKLRSFGCDGCHMLIRCNIKLPPLMRLTTNDHSLICVLFLKDFSINKVSKLLDFSYPTVRNMVDDVTKKIRESSEEFKNL